MTQPGKTVGVCALTVQGQQLCWQRHRKLEAAEEYLPYVYEWQAQTVV